MCKWIDERQLNEIRPNYGISLHKIKVKYTETIYDSVKRKEKHARQTNEFYWNFPSISLQRVNYELPLHNPSECDSVDCRKRVKEKGEQRMDW